MTDRRELALDARLRVAARQRQACDECADDRRELRGIGKRCEGERERQRQRHQRSR